MLCRRERTWLSMCQSRLHLDLAIFLMWLFCDLLIVSWRAKSPHVLALFRNEFSVRAAILFFIMQATLNESYTEPTPTECRSMFIWTLCRCSTMVRAAMRSAEFLLVIGVILSPRNLLVDVWLLVLRLAHLSTRQNRPVDLRSCIHWGPRSCRLISINHLSRSGQQIK